MFDYFLYNDPNNIDKILLDRIHTIKTKQLSKYEKDANCK